jgi:hypothetical protein
MTIAKSDLVWEVTGLKTKNEVNGDGVVLPNAICQTYWKASYTDANGNEGNFAGATPFSAANLSEEQFQQFDTLTEEVVLGWVKSIVVDSYLDHVLERIQRQIDELAVSEATMPWAPAEEEEEEEEEEAPAEPTA